MLWYCKQSVVAFFVFCHFMLSLIELDTVCVQVAAQVGHAAVGLYQALQEKNSWREMAWRWDHSG